MSFNSMSFGMSWLGKMSSVNEGAAGKKWDKRDGKQPG